ncbi:MAG: hypothetical protein ACFB50_10220 [Rubrobacteraceae bacterium]
MAADTTIGRDDYGRTLNMGVKNTGFLLDRLGQDCAPLQYLRELTQNSIEAIQATPTGRGQIAWDLDYNILELEGYYKLSIVDTGVGMTGEEMVQYINHLSSSMHTQSYEANYGVGAKVAALTRNPEGLIYLSWKNGQGYMTILWRDPRTGEYGLQQLKRPDGSYAHWIKMSDDVKPDLIQDHGTMVTLLGVSADTNTIDAPEEALYPSRWITRYLNTRYFRLPEGIAIKAIRPATGRQNLEDQRANDNIAGQEFILDKHCLASGSVDLSTAHARWWIMPTEKEFGDFGGYKNRFHITGHSAALYQDELYEMVVGNAGTVRLQHFGVILGYNRVVIYVEPKSVPGKVLTSNTARTQLLIDGEPLPWAEWAAEFREKLPQEIRALIDEVAGRSLMADHKKSIRDRLKNLIDDLFNLKRYRRKAGGKHAVTEEVVGGTPFENRNGAKNSEGSGGSSGGRAGGLYAVFADYSGDEGEEVQNDKFPSVQWVTEKDGSREPPDLDGRAARYLPEQNTLVANGDYLGFVSMIDRWQEQYASIPGSESIVKDTVREWFEQSLVEAVLGMESQRGLKEWNQADMERALSEEALTAAVMPRYHIDLAIRRILGQKIGSLKDRTAG